MARGDSGLFTQYGGTGYGPIIDEEIREPHSYYTNVVAVITWTGSGWKRQDGYMDMIL